MIQINIDKSVFFLGHYNIKFLEGEELVRLGVV